MRAAVAGGRDAGARISSSVLLRERTAGMRAALSGPLVSRRGAAMLSLGTLGSGVLAYVFNAFAARTLGPGGYGPVAVLWAAVFLVSIVLFRPIEQTLSRSIADRVARGVDARPVVRSVMRLSLLAAALPVVAVAVAWNPLTERLFHGHSALTAALAVGIAGYGLSLFVRGVMGGLRWFGGYGILLLADGAIRLALVLPWRSSPRRGSPPSPWRGPRSAAPWRRWRLMDGPRAAICARRGRPASSWVTHSRSPLRSP
ncbi:MAG: hypothetical protein QOK04_1952 [Solirubrobacteraceae bacterium]|jgi:hypothetical protein|nr:hypothetical protein [Solirubrobacteraceae bacterium]